MLQSKERFVIPPFLPPGRLQDERNPARGMQTPCPSKANHFIRDFRLTESRCGARFVSALTSGQDDGPAFIVLGGPCSAYFSFTFDVNRVSSPHEICSKPHLVVPEYHLVVPLFRTGALCGIFKFAELASLQFSEVWSWRKAIHEQTRRSKRYSRQERQLVAWPVLY